MARLGRFPEPSRERDAQSTRKPLAAQRLTEGRAKSILVVARRCASGTAPEIRHPGAAALTDQHLLGVERPVHEPRRMNGRQTASSAREDLEDLLKAPLSLLQPDAQARTIDELRDQKEPALEGPYVQHLHDMRMGDLGHGTGPFHVRAVRREQLEHHLSIQLRIVSQVNGPLALARAIEHHIAIDDGPTDHPWIRTRHCRADEGARGDAARGSIGCACCSRIAGLVRSLGGWGAPAAQGLWMSATRCAGMRSPVSVFKKATSCVFSAAERPSGRISFGPPMKLPSGSPPRS